MVRTKALRVPVRVVFYREDGEWVAHCLEFDLIGDGTTKQEALAASRGPLASKWKPPLTTTILKTFLALLTASIL